MNYRRLGRTGLQVSEIGLGTVELGLDYGVPVAGEHLRPPEEHAARLLNQALDLGVNFIDTARAYGASEEIIGRALKGRRGEYILASKLAPIREEGQSDGELAEQVKASIAESLRMLQTDVIDLLQLHWAPVDVIAKRSGAGRGPGGPTGRSGAVHRRVDLRRGGAARRACRGGGYDTLQVAYNLADRTLEEQVLPLAQQQGVGIIVRSVLLRGVLTHRYALLPDQLAESAVGDRATEPRGRWGRVQPARDGLPFRAGQPRGLHRVGGHGPQRGIGSRPGFRQWRTIDADADHGHPAGRGERPQPAQPRHLAGRHGGVAGTWTTRRDDG